MCIDCETCYVCDKAEGVLDSIFTLIDYTVSVQYVVSISNGIIGIYASIALSHDRSQCADKHSDKQGDAPKLCRA